MTCSPEQPGMTGLRATMHQPEPLLSALLTFPDPGVALVLGWAGFDYIVIDCEHGPFTLTSLRDCIEPLIAAPAAVVVRVASNNPDSIKQCLDLGADGVQVPSITSAADARAVVAAARYAPQGQRGVGMGRASRYGLKIHEYVQQANDSVAVLVMIEDAAGVANAEEIARVDGIDGVIIGPMDLSAALGVPGDTNGPVVQAAMDKVIDACARAGVKIGTWCQPHEAEQLADKGLTLLTCFGDGTGLGAAAQQACDTARKSR